MYRNTPIKTAPCAPDDPMLRRIIALHQAHGAEDYPDDSQHNMDGASLAAEGVRMFVATANGQAFAMGGWKPFGPSHAEMKSVHVLAEARGLGVGMKIVAALIEDARKAGCTRMFIETGALEAHAAARRLYERAGFTRCGPFGDYREDPNSVFMCRDL